MNEITDRAMVAVDDEGFTRSLCRSGQRVESTSLWGENYIGFPGGSPIQFGLWVWERRSEQIKGTWRRPTTEEALAVAEGRNPWDAQ